MSPLVLPVTRQTGYPKGKQLISHCPCQQRTDPVLLLAAHPYNYGAIILATLHHNAIFKF